MLTYSSNRDGRPDLAFPIDSSGGTRATNTRPDPGNKKIQKCSESLNKTEFIDSYQIQFGQSKVPKDDINSNSKDFQLKPDSTPNGLYEEILIYSYFQPKIQFRYSQYHNLLIQFYWFILMIHKPHT